MCYTIYIICFITYITKGCLFYIRNKFINKQLFRNISIYYSFYTWSIFIPLCSNCFILYYYNKHNPGNIYQHLKCWYSIIIISSFVCYCSYIIIITGLFYTCKHIYCYNIYHLVPRCSDSIILGSFIISYRPSIIIVTRIFYRNNNFFYCYIIAFNNISIYFIINYFLNFEWFWFNL